MEDLLANLQKLGFSQYEARAYVSLLQNPQVTAYELARHSGIPPSKIYEVVERLLAKELVTTVGLGGHPKYVALEPIQAVERYRRSYDQVLDALESQLEHLYAGDKGSDAYVWNLVDREDIETKAVQLVTSAGSEILVAVWASELSALEPHLAAADARGVSVAICLYGDADPGFGVVYNHVTDPVVLRDQGARRMVLVVDRGEALIGYYPEVGEVTAVWSANRGFVQMAYDYIRHDIWVVKLVRRFEIPINEAYGPTRERMRDIFHPEIPEVRVVRAPGGDAGRVLPVT
jgi:HTH-type transcriptional regulator, sugar sensing transcriptional regulator